MSSSRLWVLAVLLALAIPAFAQVPVGSIRGSVKDSSGAIVPGANVTIRNTDTAQTRTVVSGDDGEYLAPSLPLGTTTLLWSTAASRLPRGRASP